MIRPRNARPSPETVRVKEVNVRDVEHAVSDRYSGAARAPEASLCCPVTYDPALLAAIPDDVLERDYGCGDPTRFVAPNPAPPQPITSPRRLPVDLGLGGRDRGSCRKTNPRSPQVSPNRTWLIHPFTPATNSAKETSSR